MVASGLTIVTGVPEVLAKMKGVKEAKGQQLRRGLIRAGLYVQRHSQLLVPIDTSMLKNSAFTRVGGMGTTTVVTVGYTAAYAIFVHENEGVKHTNGQAKFLEAVVTERKKEIMAIIKNELVL